MLFCVNGVCFGGAFVDLMGPHYPFIPSGSWFLLGFGFVDFDEELLIAVWARVSVCHWGKGGEKNRVSVCV